MAVAERNVSTEERINTWARRISIAILAAAPGPLVALLYFRAQFQGLIFADSMDFAQIARHLSQGHGFATSLVRPLALGFTGAVGVQPDLLHAPLHAVVTAILFGVMGAKDEVIAYSSMIFYLAAIPLVYILANRIFGRKVALVSTILYVASDRLINYAVSGLPISLFTFLVTALFLVLYGRRLPEDQEAPTPRRGRALWAGALVALCYLTDYSALLFLIPVGIYLYATGGRARRSQLAFFLIAFLVVSGPWLVRNFQLTHNPFFTLSQYEVSMQSGSYPGFSLYRMAVEPPSPFLFPFTHIANMGRKLLGMSSLLYSQILSLPGLMITPFFLVGMFRGFGRRANRLRWCLYGMTAATALSTLLLHGATEILVPFLPVVIIFAAAFMLETLARTEIHPFYQNALAGLLVLLAAVPLLLTLTLGGRPETNPARPSLADLESFIPRDQVIVSDIPWAVAWYANRVSVWIPQTSTDLRRVDARGHKLNFIYLSSMLRTYPADEGVANWQQLYYQGKGLGGYKLVKVYPEQMELFARESMVRVETRPAR